jgi:hypothetical protein
MARIAGVPERQAGAFVRIAYWLVRRRLGAVPEPTRLMAHQPRVLRAAGAFEMAFDRARRVDAKLKVLAQIKVATRVGCSF